MFLSQTRYIVDLLNRANMLGAKPVSSHPRDSYLAQSCYWRPTSRSHTVLQSYWSIPITYINKARHFICHKSSMPIHAYPHQWTHVFSQTDAPLPQRYNTVWTPSPTRPTATHCILWCWLGWWSRGPPLYQWLLCLFWSKFHLMEFLKATHNMYQFINRI